MVTNVETKKEYVKFDFVSTNKIDSVTMWPEKDSSTLGSYSISGEGAFTNDADPDRQIYVVDQDGYRATKFKAGVVYTVYFYLNEGETMVHFGSFNGTTIYIANIACGNGEIIPIEPENPEPDDPDVPEVPEVPNYVMQGDSREPVAAYTGDVTELGFAAGTTVYVIENKQAGLWDDCWYTRLSLPLEGTQKSVAIEFIGLQEFSGE
jgi:hypothetical protein